MKETREHHYLFAHRVLPHLAWDNPEGFYVTAFTDEASEHLHQWWVTLGNQLDEEHRLPPEGLSWSAFPYDEHLVVTCRFPQPEAMTEAYFATIICGPLKDLTKEALEASPMRYILLEYGLDADMKTPRTVLCEWTREGSHLNRGDGPEPELEIFEAVALQIVVGDSPGEALHKLTSLGSGDIAPEVELDEDDFDFDEDDLEDGDEDDERGFGSGGR